jgi:hypothetical protein
MPTNAAPWPPSRQGMGKGTKGVAVSHRPYCGENDHCPHGYVACAPSTVNCQPSAHPASFHPLVGMLEFPAAWKQVAPAHSVLWAKHSPTPSFGV